MKLALFGATGKTGQHLLKQALEAGHEVVVLARDPSKLALQDARLTVIQGDVRDMQCVEQVVKGTDAVLSVLGPTSNKPEFAVTKGTQNILAAMHKYGVRRLVISAGAGVGDPADKPKLFNHAISLMLRMMAKNVYQDMVQVVDLVRKSDLEWTVVRVPMLTDAPATGNIRVGVVGQGTGARLSRADMASFMLKQVAEHTRLRQAPVISN